MISINVYFVSLQFIRGVSTGTLLVQFSYISVGSILGSRFYSLWSEYYRIKRYCVFSDR